MSSVIELTAWCALITWAALTLMMPHWSDKRWYAPTSYLLFLIVTAFAIAGMKGWW